MPRASGAPSRIRTCNPRLRRPVPYPVWPSERCGAYLSANRPVREPGSGVPHPSPSTPRRGSRSCQFRSASTRVPIENGRLLGIGVVARPVEQARRGLARPGEGVHDGSRGRGTRAPRLAAASICSTAAASGANVANNAAKNVPSSRFVPVIRGLPVGRLAEDRDVARELDATSLKRDC